MAIRCLAVIPARMGSSRFPGKPLANLEGRAMIEWVVDAVQVSKAVDRIVVATPDDEILDFCNGKGIDAQRTSHHHLTGTDRVAEVALSVEADVYLNVQGDEPLLQSETVRACASALLDNPGDVLSSVWCPSTDPTDDANPAVVKVVLDLQGYALYFSRHAIPYPRAPRGGSLKKHVGVYGFRRSALEAFSKWRQTELEATETLEQLRFLEHGFRIRMVEGPGTELAVDTPQQADEVRRILRARTSKCG